MYTQRLVAIHQLPITQIQGQVAIDIQCVGDPGLQRGAPLTVTQSTQIGNEVQGFVEPNIQAVHRITGCGLKGQILLHRRLVHVLTEIQTERVDVIRDQRAHGCITAIGLWHLRKQNFNILHITGRPHRRPHLLYGEILFHRLLVAHRQGIDPAKQQLGRGVILTGKIEILAADPPCKNFVTSIIQQNLLLTGDQVLFANDIFCSKPLPWIVVVQVIEIPPGDLAGRATAQPPNGQFGKMGRALTGIGQNLIDAHPITTLRKHAIQSAIVPNNDLMCHRRPRLPHLVKRRKKGPVDPTRLLRAGEENAGPCLLVVPAPKNGAMGIPKEKGR